MDQGLRAIYLYRAILRAHRRIPLRIRTIGDAFVKHEFRQHRNATAAFLVRFFVEWEAYLKNLEHSTVSSQYGSHLTDDKLKSLNSDQVQKVLDLKEKIKPK